MTDRSVSHFYGDGCDPPHPEPLLNDPSRFMRFWSQVLIGDGCWEWQGSIPGGPHGGYGRCTGGLAHRVAYEFCVGPIPADKELDHLCRNRACVRPDHLEPVTHRINMLRAPFARRPVCPRGHPLQAPNLYLTRTGTRQCKECRRMHQASRPSASRNAGRRREAVSKMEAVGALSDVGWISDRSAQTGTSLNPRGGLGNRKGPLRLVVETLAPQASMFSPALVRLECGHAARSWGGQRARCPKCAPALLSKVSGT